MAYLRYGGTTFPRDSAKVERSIEFLAPAGIPLWTKQTWTCTVVLNPDNVGGTTAEQIAGNYALTEGQMYAALIVRNRELALYSDGGTRLIYLPAVAPNIGANGPTTMFFANPIGDGTEFAGMRTFTFQTTATYPVADLSRVLVNFQESLSFRGSGAPAKVIRIGMRMAVNQYPRAASICTASQSGTATGAIARPLWAVPPPIWKGGDHDSDQNQTSMTGGIRQGDSLTNFTVSWNYNFSRAGKPFVGVPHEFV